MNIASSTTPPVAVNYSDTIDAHIAILGMTGSGKTNTIYVFAEEILRAGGLLTIFDPEGDFGLLKLGFPLLIVGKGRLGNDVDMVISPDDAPQLAVSLAHRHQSVILDLSGYKTEVQDEFVAKYLSTLWECYSNEDLPPMRVVLDEVQLFAPQAGKTQSKLIVNDIANRGRKRKFTLMVATQRPQRIEKGVLDATAIRLFHSMEKGKGLDAIAELLPDQIANAKARIPMLKRGEAILKYHREASVIQVRESDTFRADKSVSALPTPPQPIDEKWLEELRTQLQSTQPQITSSSSGPLPQGTNFLRVSAELKLCKEDLTRALERVEELQIANDLLQLQLNITHNETAEQPTLPVFNAPTLVYRSEMAVKRARSAQRKGFEKLLDVLTRQKSYHRRILAVLLTSNRETMNVNEIALLANLSESTMRKGPPTELIKLGLMKSIRSGRRVAAYSQQVGQYLKRSYPDLDCSALQEEMIIRLNAA